MAGRFLCVVFSMQALSYLTHTLSSDLLSGLASTRESALENNTSTGSNTQRSDAAPVPLTRVTAPETSAQQDWQTMLPQPTYDPTSTTHNSSSTPDPQPHHESADIGSSDWWQLYSLQNPGSFNGNYTQDIYQVGPQPQFAQDHVLDDDLMSTWLNAPNSLRYAVIVLTHYLLPDPLAAQMNGGCILRI